MDHVTDRAIEARGDTVRDSELNASEPMSRLVAYSSPYIFWATVVSLSAGILLLQ